MTYPFMDYLPPWIPQPIADLWEEHYDLTGDGNLAWEAVRQDPLYEQYYPGNTREDGSTRLSEAVYHSTIEGYRLTLEAADVNPDLFQERFADLIRGEVDVDEFELRVASLQENILESAPEIRNWYAENYALNMSNEAILATALDPTGVGNAILTKQIGIAQVGGEAAIRAFEISSDLATRLYEAGGITSSAAAAELFGLAAGAVPILNTLAARHDDPDDDFDINEFVYGTVMDDPDQRRRMQRLIAQEKSLFKTLGGGAARNAAGGISGLSTL